MESQTQCQPLEPNTCLPGRWTPSVRTGTCGSWRLESLGSIKRARETQFCCLPGSAPSCTCPKEHLFLTGTSSAWMVAALATEEGGCRRPIFHFFSQRCYSKDLDQKDAIDLPNHGGKLRIREEISQPMQSAYDMCVAPFPVIPGCAKNVHLVSLQGPGQEVVSQG